MNTNHYFAGDFTVPAELRASFPDIQPNEPDSSAETRRPAARPARPSRGRSPSVSRSRSRSRTRTRVRSRSQSRSPPPYERRSNRRSQKEPANVFIPDPPEEVPQVNYFPSDPSYQPLPPQPFHQYPEGLPSRPRPRTFTPPEHFPEHEHDHRDPESGKDGKKNDDLSSDDDDDGVNVHENTNAADLDREEARKRRRDGDHARGHGRRGRHFGAQGHHHHHHHPPPPPPPGPHGPHAHSHHGAPNYHDSENPWARPGGGCPWPGMNMNMGANDNPWASGPHNSTGPRGAGFGGPGFNFGFNFGGPGSGARGRSGWHRGGGWAGPAGAGMRGHPFGGPHRHHPHGGARGGPGAGAWFQNQRGTSGPWAGTGFPFGSGEDVQRLLANVFAAVGLGGNGNGARAGANDASASASGSAPAAASAAAPEPETRGAESDGNNATAAAGPNANPGIDYLSLARTFMEQLAPEFLPGASQNRGSSRDPAQAFAAEAVAAANGGQAARGGNGDEQEEEEEEDDGAFEPPADVYSSAELYVVHVSLPGAKKEDLDVSWADRSGELKIQGVVTRKAEALGTEKANEEGEGGMLLEYAEREVGLFRKVVRLGGDGGDNLVDVEGITAKMEEGVLVVRVPKRSAEDEFEVVRKVDVL